MPIRKRVWGARQQKKRRDWVLDYYDRAGKRRQKSFTQRRDAEEFAEAVRIRIAGGPAIINDESLDYTIYQERLYMAETADPLTVRAIIHQIGKSCMTVKLSNSERAFVADFATAEDRGTFIEDRFLRAAIEGGKTLRTHTSRNPDEVEDAGWVGLHRFFGMYVVNCTQYGEGQDDYGPFAKMKDARVVFDSAVLFNLPI